VKRFLFALLVVAAASCTSPEATRTQGGGPGGDTGNRGAVVQMHEGSKPYENTPHLNPAAPPPLDSANHARSFGR
jgi:hypothetical protein